MCLLFLTLFHINSFVTGNLCFSHMVSSLFSSQYHIMVWEASLIPIDHSDVHGSLKRLFEVLDVYWDSSAFLDLII